MNTQDFELDSYDDSFLLNKCATIYYYSEKGIFIFSCSLCDQKYLCSDNFLLHYSEVHLLLEECNQDMDASGNEEENIGLNSSDLECDDNEDEENLIDHFQLQKEINENPAPTSAHEIDINEEYFDKDVEEEEEELKLLKYGAAPLEAAIEDPQIRCLTCSQIYDRVDEFREHMKSHDNYICPKCSAGFIFKRRFDLHTTCFNTKYECTNLDNPHKCCLCDFAFNSKWNLKKHLKLHFEIENHRGKKRDSKTKKTYKCHICGVSRANEATLRNHIRRHSEENRSFQCESCPRKFFTRGELVQHTKYVHSSDRPFLCSDCGASFPLVSRLKVHNRKNHSMRENNWKCELCPKAFFEKSNLRYHMLTTHADERNYQCSLCDGAFKSQKAMAAHMKIHENKRQYVCEVCKKGFNQHSTLKSHLKSAHHNLSKNSLST